MRLNYHFFARISCNCVKEKLLFVVCVCFTERLSSSKLDNKWLKTNRSSEEKLPSPLTLMEMPCNETELIST